MFLWWLYLAGSSVGFSLGSLLLKRFADTSAWSALTFAFTIFAVSNLLFVQVLKQGLGQGVVASSMFQIILMAVLGVLIFDERMSMSQVSGVALAALSILLMLYRGDVES